MTSSLGGQRVRKAIVIIHGIQPTEKSAADIADAIKTLASSFEILILTNGPSECRRVFPDARILKLPLMPFRGEVLAFCLECVLVLPLLRADLVFVAGVEYTPAVTLNITKPVLCYGNSNPAQHVQTTKRKGGIFSSVLSRINGLAMGIGLQRCDTILAISPQLRDVFVAEGTDSSRVEVMNLGVQLKDYAPQAGRKGRAAKRLWRGIYHGTLSKERGLELIVEAASRLASQRRDFKIELVGCTPSEKELVRETIRKAGAEHVIDVRPPVPHSEIPGLLRGADFGLSLLEPNAYFSTSPPVKVLEFLAAGLPVIANDIPTHLLYLKDGVNAMIVPYKAEALAQAMNAMISDPSRRDELSENALKTAQQFSIESTHHSLLEAALKLADR